MTTDFVVLGERRDDPSQLLLRGDDGGFYAYDLTTGRVSAIEVDAAWTMDPPRAPVEAPPEPRPDDDALEERGHTSLMGDAP